MNQEILKKCWNDLKSNHCGLYFLLTDIQISMIYKLYLKNISKYKMDDLLSICKDMDIDIMKGTKKKLKKDLYDEINMKKLNENW